MAGTPNYMGTVRNLSCSISAAAETDLLVPAHTTSLVTGASGGTKIHRLGIQILSTSLTPTAAPDVFAYFFKSTGGLLIPPVPFGGLSGNFIELYYDDDPPRSRPLFVADGVSIIVSQSGTVADAIALADVFDG